MNVQIEQSQPVDRPVRVSQPDVLSLRPRTRSALRTVGPWALAALVLIGGLSVARFRGYNVGMLDLGNISQAIWSVTQGYPLVYTSPAGNISRLAGHVELIYFALVPLMRVWPNPQVLLLAQSALAVSGMFPVYRIASRRLPHTPSLLFALGYVLFPTAVAAMLFDIHGDTLAMPLLLWMLDALDEGAWRRFGVFLALSLLCKFYIAAPVFLLGLTLLTHRTAPFDLQHVFVRRKVGIAVCAAAAAYGMFVLFGLRPFFATTASGGSTDYARFYFGALTTLGWADLLDRVVNVLAVLLPSALLFVWGGWTAFPALAIMLPAVLSTGPGASFAWSYHHYAAAVPFLIAGSIVGAARRVHRITKPRGRVREARLAGALFFGASLLLHVALNDTPFGLTFWRAQPGAGLDASAYGRTERDALKDSWLRTHIPPSVPLAASNFLAPHLINRSTLFLTRYPDERTPERLKQHLHSVQIVVADALFDWTQATGSGYVGGVLYDRDAIRLLLQTSGWALTEARDGLLRFERNASYEHTLRQSIQQVKDLSPARTNFGDAVELVNSSVEPLGERRFRTTFRWRARRDVGADEQLIAVSRLDGVPNARIVHLPSFALQPTNTWKRGQVWEEQFDVLLPAEIAPNGYEWRVGWYDARNPYAAWTDARSRVGDEATITTINVR